MGILNVTWCDEALTQINILFDGGKRACVAYPGGTWHTGAVRQWVQQGNEIDPYTQPPATTPDDITNILLTSDYSKGLLGVLYSLYLGAPEGLTKPQFKALVKAAFKAAL